MDLLGGAGLEETAVGAEIGVAISGGGRAFGFLEELGGVAVLDDLVDRDADEGEAHAEDPGGGGVGTLAPVLGFQGLLGGAAEAGSAAVAGVAAVDDVQFGGGKPLTKDRFIGGFANGEDDALAVIAVFVVADLSTWGKRGRRGSK